MSLLLAEVAAESSIWNAVLPFLGQAVGAVVMAALMLKYLAKRDDAQQKVQEGTAKTFADALDRLKDDFTSTMTAVKNEWVTANRENTENNRQITSSMMGMNKDMVQTVAIVNSRMGEQATIVNDLGKSVVEQKAAIVELKGAINEQRVSINEQRVAVTGLQESVKQLGDKVDRMGDKK